MIIGSVAAATIVGASLVAAPQVTAPKPCAIQSGVYQNFQYRGVNRKFKAYIPPGANSQTKLIISMHGATGSSESQEKVSGFSGRDFIAVYPQSLGESPNTLWNLDPAGPDIGYVTELTKFLHANGCGSPNNTYINGFSMGAMMTSTLMCTSSHLYAGAAMVGGVLEPLKGCTIGKNKPVLVVHGVTDQTVLFNGTMAPRVAMFTPPTATTHYSRLQTTRHWHLAKKPSSVGAFVNDTAKVKYVTYFTPGSKNSSIVILKSEGHVWRTSSVDVSKLILEAMK